MSAAPFQPPPRQTQRADFPHWAFLFASCQGLCGLSGWLDFRRWPANPVPIKQTEFVIEPLPTPPSPAEALPLPRPHHMPPNLLVYPVFDKREAPARMPHRKVVHPSPKNWIDQVDHPLHRLTGVPSEHIPEFCQQRRSLLQPRRIVGSPRSFKTQNAAKLKSQKSETVSLCEVGESTFLLVDLNSQFGQLLPQSLVHRLHQPVMPRMSVDQY